MAELLGADGAPIPKKFSNEFIAAPSLSGFRQSWTGEYPATNLTPEKIARALRAADSGYERPWLLMAEELEEKDGHYAAILNVRKRAIKQLPITIVPAGEEKYQTEHADFLRDWLNTGCLSDALMDMLDALGKSFSVHEIEWKTKGQIWPRKLHWRQPHWFGVECLGGEEVMLRNGFDLVPLEGWKFLVHKYKNKSGALIRGSLSRVAVWTWMFKAFTMRDWATFVQTYGTPIRIGRYGLDATDDDKQVLLDALTNIAGDLAGIMPKGMEVEFVGMKEKSATTDLYIERCKYLDYALSKIVLGQTTTTDAVAGGHAVSQEHDKVRQDIERADATDLSATLTRQLVPIIIYANFGPQKTYPMIQIGRPDEIPLKDIAAAMQVMGPMGLTVQASIIRARMGVPDPAPGDEVIGGVAKNVNTKTVSPANPDDTSTEDNNSALMSRLSHKTMMRKGTGDPEPFDIVEAMTRRVARDAAGALGGMTAQIKAVFDEAEDLTDAAHKLAHLELDAGNYEDVLARGLALAHLAGQASVLDDIAQAHPEITIKRPVKTARKPKEK